MRKKEQSLLSVVSVEAKWICNCFAAHTGSWGEFVLGGKSTHWKKERWTVLKGQFSAMLPVFVSVFAKGAHQSGSQHPDVTCSPHPDCSILDETTWPWGNPELCLNRQSWSKNHTGGNDSATGLQENRVRQRWQEILSWRKCIKCKG